MDQSSDGATVNVPESAPPRGDGFVDVRGFRATTTEETLRNFLENKKRTGGGELRSLTVDNRKAIACFTDPQVAARLTARGTLTLEGSEVKVNYPDDDTYQYSIYYDRTIEVSGFPQSATRDALWYFFENPKNGGGKTKFFRMINQGYSALVTFEGDSVARQLLQGGVQFQGYQLDITAPYRRSAAEYLDSDDSMESDNSGQTDEEESDDKARSQHQYSVSAQEVIQPAAARVMSRGQHYEDEGDDIHHSHHPYSVSPQEGVLQESGRSDVARGDSARGQASRDDRSEIFRSQQSLTENNRPAVPDDLSGSHDIYKTARDGTDCPDLHQDGASSNPEFADDGVKADSGLDAAQADGDPATIDRDIERTLPALLDLDSSKPKPDGRNSSSPDFDIIDDNNSDNNVTDEAAPYPYEGNLLDNLWKHHDQDPSAGS